MSKNARISSGAPLYLFISIFLGASVSNSLVFSSVVTEIGDLLLCNTTDSSCVSENCNPQDKCFRNCDSSTSMQMFDEDLLKCVNLVGENCKLNEDCVSKSVCKPEWNTKEGLFEGKCRCDLKYFEHTNNRTCGRRAFYGEMCDEETNPCETTLFMKCKEGICQCDNNDTQIYDPIKKSCAIRTGTGCYNYRTLPWYLPCVQNAECKYFFTKRNAVKCKCAKGYIETPEGFCGASFGHNCNSTSVCHSSGNLVCSDGKCQCDSPMYQVFDKIAKKCSGIVGTTCTAKEDCLSTALCDETTLKCKCDHSYTETQDYLCELSFGQKCNISQFECNSHRGLTCKNGLCKCFDSTLEFDAKLEYCKVKDIGSRCGVFTNGATNQRSFHAQCDSKMACFKYEAVLGKDGPCYCQGLPVEDNNVSQKHLLCGS